jgi:hypothetical protein
MNAWRWLGACLVLVALSLTASVSGQGKDGKDKGGKDKGDKTKQDEKGKGDKKGDEKAGKKSPGAGTKIEWKAFEKAGAKFYQEMTTNTDQTMKVMQMEVKQKQSQTFYIEWTVEKAEKDYWQVKQKIIGVKMDIEIGGNKISFDSQAKEQQANPLTDFFKALIDAEFTLKIDRKDMNVTEVSGQKEFVQRLAKANPQLQPLLNAILSENALKQMADPVFSAVPPGGVVPDSGEWKRESKLDMGPIGTYDTTYTYTYKDTKDKVASIDVASTLKYTPPGGKGAEGLPFKIVSATLKSDKGTGEVKFDLEKGRIASSSMNLNLTGDLTIEIAGMTTDVNLTQKQDSTLRTTDTNPIKTASK